MLRLRPISLRDANEYVRKYHRHHKPVAGHKFSIGCEADGELVGVIIAGRPVSRYLDDGFTLEVIMPQLARSAGATEALKATDPMKWVGLMNACRAQAEEIAKFELIYV